QVSWVPQRPHLFSGTIGDNLRLANPDAPDDALADAISTAGLGELLGRLPDGISTAIGEGGAALSAGERQRIAIARAVLHGGHLLLLDEIGSHLDEPAWLALRASLEPWLDGRTVVVAAHHPDVVLGLDDVITLGSPVSADTLPSTRA